MFAWRADRVLDALAVIAQASTSLRSLTMTGMTSDQLDSLHTSLATSGVGIGELETFITVAELGSFSKAAKQLELSQPAVTARVQKLESLLGTRLLRRTTRSVDMTDAGRRLALHARQTLRDLRELMSEFSQGSAGVRSQVTIASTPMLAATLLPGAVLRFSRRFPHVDVHVRDLRYASAIACLERGEADMAVLALEEPRAKLRFTPLIEDELVLLVPAGHALAKRTSIRLQDLSPYPLMVLDKYSALRTKVSEEYERQGQRFRPAATALNLTTLLGMLDAGLGITFSPRLMAQYNAKQARVVVPVQGSELHRLYGIFVPLTTELTAAARGFFDFLHAESAEHALVPQAS